MSRRNAVLSIALLLTAFAAALAFILVLSGIVPVWKRAFLDADFGPPELLIESARFADLEGWSADDQGEAVAAFARSCARLDALTDDMPANPDEALGPPFEEMSLGGRAADWRPACAAARALLLAAPADREAASAAGRLFFETHFTPARILSRRRPAPGAGAAVRPRVAQTGLFTGYFEPSYEAREAPAGRFTAPVLARPFDLVMVDLGLFRDALAGERVAGLVEGGRLLPYPDHQAINDGALGARAVPLAFVDPNDLFFLQIQGSGRLVFADGRALRVGYDGWNGRQYWAVGRTLIERGALARENVSMQTIRAWLDAAPPDEARALRETNPSYVFFRPLELEDPALGPLGSDGAQLAASRSLAVDRRYHALGLPVWLSFDGSASAMSGLYIAQDSGGAIKGPLRGDIFLGSGAAAGEIAGRLRAEGEMVALLPRPVAAKLEAPRASGDL